VKINSFRSISTLLILAVMLSMLLVVTPVSAAAFRDTNYSGKIIQVTQGKTFVLRTEVTWDEEGVPGYYGVTLVWEDNNHAYDNFTVLYTKVFFDNDDDNSPDAGVAMIENTTELTSGSGTDGKRWTLRVYNTAGNDNDGLVDIEICMQAASRGIIHRPTDNHWINKSGWGGSIDYAESTPLSTTPIVTTIKVLAWTSGVLVRGGPNAFDNTQPANPPKYVSYGAGSNPPLAAAQRIGSGAVFAAGLTSTLDNGRWNLATNPYGATLDEFLDSVFQWMVPGADNVLWFTGYGVFQKLTRTAHIEENLTLKGYTVVEDNLVDNDITVAKLAPYDILIIPGLQLGARWTGGDPSLLPDNNVEAINSWVNAGGGLAIFNNTDFSGYNYYRVHNKILKKLGFGWRFQCDSVYDNVDNFGNATYYIKAQVLQSCPGCGYWNSTGYENIGVYSVTSLVTPPTMSVDVQISPANRAGVSPSTLNYTVTVINTGTTWDNYALSIDNTQPWTHSLENTKLYVPAGENRTTTLSVSIPSGTASCTWDYMTVTATSSEDPTIKDNATCGAHSLGALEFVFISPKSQFGENENVYFYITVKNTSDNTDNFILAIENIDNAEWPVAFENIITPDNRVENVPPGENKVVKLTVTIPDNAILGFGNEIWVKATSQADNTKSDNDNCAAYAGVFGVQVSISPGESSGMTGTTVTFTVTVSNTGNIADTYNIIARSGLGWSASTDVSSLTIPVSENRTTTLRVTIPDGATHCTRDTVTVTARSITDMVENSASCTVHAVKIIRGVSVSISPSSQVGMPDVTLSYTVTVTNTGEATDNFDLRISGGAGWSPGISPSSLSLAVGASGTAALTVTVPSGAAEGDSTTIAVIATSRADPSVSGSASCRAIASAPLAGPEVPPPAVETQGLAIAIMVVAVVTIVLSLGYIFKP